MNSLNAKVSVVTITYGHEKYITDTLNGVLMQQYDGPIEFIIAEDCSPDGTAAAIETYFAENLAPDNFEIRYTRHDENKGMMPNFIWALQQAKGKYIAMCEGDDYWTDPLKLEKQVRFLEENTAYSFCTHRFLIKSDGFNNDKNIISNTEKDETSGYGEQFYNGNNVEIDYRMFYRAWLTQPLSTVLRREFMEGLIPFSQNFTYFRDVHLFYYLLKRGNGFSFNSYMAVYRRHAGGEESGKNDRERVLLKMKIWKELFEHYPSDRNLRTQYVESTLRYIEFTDQAMRLKLYKELLRVSNSIYFFTKVNYKFIRGYMKKRVR